MLEMNRTVAKFLLAMATVGTVVTALTAFAALVGVGYLMFRGVAAVLSL